MARFVDYQTICDEHLCPMMEAEGEAGCLLEFVDNHLGGLQVTDIVPDSGVNQPGALIFSDGHALPLLCPHCGKAIDLDSPEERLAEVSGLWLVALEYADENDEKHLILLLAEDPEADPDNDEALLEYPSTPRAPGV